MAQQMIIQSTTGPYETEIQRLRKAFDAADAVLVGAGAGLATACGYAYAGERLDRYFGDFIRKYGVRDMYTGAWAPFTSWRERWAFWSRWAWVNRFCPIPGDTLEKLQELLGGKDWFALTTNIDHALQRAGFSKERLRYTQGELGLFQCYMPCCQETWEAHDALAQMMEAQGFRIAEDNELIVPESGLKMTIPAELVPHCPHCGGPADLNLYWDDRFVRDKGWHEAARRYEAWLSAHEGKRMLYVEIGVGFNSPGVIKYPFYNMTAANPKATYVCINLGEPCYLSGIRDQSIALDADVNQVICNLLEIDKEN